MSMPNAAVGTLDFTPPRRCLILGASGSGLSRCGEQLYRGSDDAAMLTQDAISHITFLRETVIEEIAFGLEQRGVEQEDMAQRVRAVMDGLDIAHLEYRNPAALSGGQTKRVAMACVAVLGAKLLIADDPFAGLDKDSRMVLAGFLDAYPGTVVIVAHEPPEELPSHFARFELAPEGIVANPRRRIRPVQLPAPVPPTGEVAPEGLVYDLGCVQGHRVQARKRWWQLQKRQGDSFSTRPIRLRLQAGSVLWLRGANGVGKTTVLRALAGLDPVFELHSTPAVCVSLQTQRAMDQIICSSVEALIPDLTWREMLSVEPDTHPLDLPQSQLRLVQVASVLAQQRELVALDEPDVGIDHADRETLHRMLARALATGQAIIMTCHDESVMAEIATYARVHEATLHAPEC